MERLTTDFEGLDFFWKIWLITLQLPYKDDGKIVVAGGTIFLLLDFARYNTDSALIARTKMEPLIFLLAMML